MANELHKIGNRYRMWSTTVDDYISKTLTKGQMKKWIAKDMKSKGYPNNIYKEKVNREITDQFKFANQL